jgi:O-antigen/teichoic acid export membrane protein
VGIYSMAAALYEGSIQLAVVIQNNLNPVLARALAEGRLDDVHALVRRTRRWFVPGLVGLAALGAATYPVLIPWLMGHDYIGGAVPFAIMMIGVAIASPYLPFAQTLLMASRPGWHTFYILGVLAVGFVANLALIGPLGLPGAATAAAASAVASAVLLRQLVRKLVEVRL